MALRQAGIRFSQDDYKWLAERSEATSVPISALVRQAVQLLRDEEDLREQLKAGIVAKGVTYPSLESPTKGGWAKAKVNLQ